MVPRSGIMDLLGAAFKFYETTWNKGNPIGWPHTFLYNPWISVAAFALLAIRCITSPASR